MMTARTFSNFWRFNSATAVMPWKTARAGEGASPSRCFNSATAVMPWKTRIDRHFARIVRGFNSATAVMPWKTRPPSPHHGEPNEMLQFGHGGDAVENANDSRRAAERHDASIRPRR